MRNALAAFTSKESALYEVRKPHSPLLFRYSKWPLEQLFLLWSQNKRILGMEEVGRVLFYSLHYLVV